jgi:hypothetical protein
MKKGESRFFLNWQMSKEISSQLYNSKNDGSRTIVISDWLRDKGVAENIETINLEIIKTYFENIFDHTRKLRLNETKMSCFMEIMFYIMK